MKIKLLTSLMTILVSTSICTACSPEQKEANTENKNAVVDKVVQVKDSIKDTSVESYEKFKMHASNMYDSLSAKIEKLVEYSKDKKDDAVEALVAKRDKLKAKIDDYNAKREEERIESEKAEIIKQIEELDKHIIEYNEKYGNK